MYNSVNEFMEKISSKNTAQPEFIQAVQEVVVSILLKLTQEF